MRNIVTNLPEVVRNVFIEELDRQYSRSELMDKDEFRRNFIIGLHKCMSGDEYEIYYNSIWDLIGIIELDLLKGKHAVKIFRCINESGIPIQHHLIKTRLSDPTYVINSIVNTPGLLDYVLDYVLEHINIHSDSDILKILQECLIDMNINSLSYMASISDDEGMLVDKMTPILKSDKEEYDDVNDRQMKLFDPIILSSYEDSMELDLEISINDILEYTTNQFIDKLTHGESLDRAGFIMELNIAYQLEEVIISSSELMETIGTGPKFYKLVKKMSDIVESEVITFIIESIRQNSKHNSVRVTLATLMKYYIESKI